MILRLRSSLRSRTPKKSKVFTNKIKPRRKETPKKLNQLVELPKATKAIDILQNSLKKRLSKVKEQVNILKYQLPNVPLNAQKYSLRNLSCGIDDLLFLTSTPNKSNRESKKAKAFGVKDSSHVKNISVSNQKKSDGFSIKYASQDQDRKNGLSISPIPFVQKVPNLRKRKKSATISSTHLVNKQILPLNKKRKSQLASQQDSPRKSPVKTRSRTSLSSMSFFIEDSPQKKKKSSFTKNNYEESSAINEKKKKLVTPLKKVRKDSMSHLSNCSLTEDTIPNKSNLTSSKSYPKKSFQKKDLNKSNLTSKSCSKKPFQKNKRKKQHSGTSKTKESINKTEDSKKRNKIEVSGFCRVVLKRISPRLHLKRDDLNISSKNTTKKKLKSSSFNGQLRVLKRVSPRLHLKRDDLNISSKNTAKENVSSIKLKSSSFNGHQKSLKSRRIKDDTFEKSCDISNPNTSKKGSPIQDITSKKSFCNSCKKGNSFRKKNIQVESNNSVLNHSRTGSKVQLKERYPVPAAKKKNNTLRNSKNSKSSDKAVKSSVKSPVKFPTLLMGNKDFCNKNNIPVDDLITASFITPSKFLKSRNKKSNQSEVTPRPLNKKALLKLKPDVLTCQEMPFPNKKLPGKGTLKRKRIVLNALKEKSEGYEDDIFESTEFQIFKETLFMDDDSDTSGMSIVTPKCAFLETPRMPDKTPHYKDCFSPMELMRARKVAEEYIYRRNKRILQGSTLSESQSSLQMRNANQQNEKSTNEDPEKRKLDFISLAKSLKGKEDKSADSDEDVYFSDASS